MGQQHVVSRVRDAARVGGAGGMREGRLTAHHVGAPTHVLTDTPRRSASLARRPSTSTCDLSLEDKEGMKLLTTS